MKTNQKIIHIREIENIKTREKKFVFHKPLKTDENRITNNNGITIAIQEKDEKLYWGFAKCNPKDNYSKRIGRNIAVGRSTKGQYITAIVDKEIIKLIIQKIIELNNGSNAFNAWLELIFNFENKDHKNNIEYKEIYNI